MNAALRAVLEPIEASCRLGRLSRPGGVQGEIDPGEPASHFGRGADAPIVLVAQRELFRAGQAVADLPPVDQVAAVEGRHAGEIGERGGDQGVILADSTDGWVWVKAGDNWVGVHYKRL